MSNAKKVTIVEKEKISFENTTDKLNILDLQISQLKKENDQIKKDLIYQKKQNFLKSASLKEYEQDTRRLLLDLIKSQELLVDFASKIHVVRDDKKNSNNELEEKIRQLHEISESLVNYEKDVDSLLMHLMQTQENLIELHQEKETYKNQYEAIRVRWSRVEKYQPDYVDVGALELISFDHTSDTPTTEWQLKGFERAGELISSLTFRLGLFDGCAGLGLIKSIQSDQGIDYFVPKNIELSKEQLDIFLKFTTNEFNEILSLILIFKKLEESNWLNFQCPKNFDLSFWRPIIASLVKQLEGLPTVLRFNEVRLKRELINPDYEHLWLEFHGLKNYRTFWNKFELRLGAALVQSDGFSQYPKFEFPLIDGKTKPFESWYAESHDDSGPKVELRFALDKKVFDTAVFTKLSDVDRVLLLRLINAVPDALERLQAKNTPIHRPWSQWIDFAQGAVDTLKTVRAATQASQSQATAESAKQAMAQIASPATTQSASSLASATAPQQPTQVAATSRAVTPVATGGGLKVISVSSKVIASKSIASKAKTIQLRSASHQKKKKKA